VGGAPFPLDEWGVPVGGWVFSPVGGGAGTNTAHKTISRRPQADTKCRKEQQNEVTAPGTSHQEQSPSQERSSRIMERTRRRRRRRTRSSSGGTPPMDLDMDKAADTIHT